MIRPTSDKDRSSIRALHLEAFGTGEGEAVSALVLDLLDDPTARPLLSLAAEQQGELQGHVLFTAVAVEGGDSGRQDYILAPLGVTPSVQGKGIGGALVREGLERLRSQGAGLVFVLGHPGYYPKFGFEPAGRLGLDAPYEIPGAVAGAWMVQELRPGLLGGVQGTVRCSRVLDRPEHWRE